MAQSLTGPEGCNALTAAPVPRLPQPTSAILSVSSPAACTGRTREVSDAAAAAAPAEPWRNLRREADERSAPCDMTRLRTGVRTLDMVFDVAVGRIDEGGLPQSTAQQSSRDERDSGRQKSRER